MTTLFISDLHLSPERQEIIDLFLQFMNERAKQARTLYILGDFFEVWIGDDYIPEELQNVIRALAEYSSAGNKLYFIRGNRDFLLRKEFEEMTGCEILPDPCLIDLDGKPTLISHGDMLCTDDVEYMEFRKKVRAPSWQKNFLNQSIEERLAFANDAREQSKIKTKNKPLQIMDANPNAILKLMSKYNVEQMIHGHTHRPAIHTIKTDQNPLTRIVLGDWYEQGSVLECIDGKCELQTIENQQISNAVNMASGSRE